MINTNLKNATITSKTPSEARSAERLGNITESSANSPRATSYRYKYHLLDAAQKYLKDYRVSSCQRVPVGYAPNNDYSSFEVNLGRSDSGMTKFGGLSYCGNLWQCPCCAGNVAKTKSTEVVHAMAENAKRGGQSVFLTLTQPHQGSDPLKKLVDIQQKSASQLFQNGTLKRLLSSLGYLGQIRAFEVTHGANGWHPHLHIILLFDTTKVIKAAASLESVVYKFWSKYVVQNGGLLPSEKHGVDLRLPRKSDSEEIGSYIAKWGLEVTNTHTKKGRLKESRTPFQILDDIADEYNPRDQALLIEYAKATHKRSRIYWTPKLKQHFNIEEITDAELANAPVREVVFSLGWLDFCVIRRLKLCGDLLDLAATASRGFLTNYVRFVVDAFNEEQRRLGALRFRERRELIEQIRKTTDEQIQELQSLGLCPLIA